MRKIVSFRIEEESWTKLGEIAKSMRFTRAEFIETMVKLMEGAEEKPFAQLIEQNLLGVIAEKLQKGGIQRQVRKK
jgi:predicted DNA-binding ribbon-helix-helix protein